MAKTVSSKEAEELLRDRLLGASINLVSYFITGWKLRLMSAQGPEYHIRASEIVPHELEKWRTKLVGLPVDILNTNEPDDVITAAVIFSVLNKWPIIEVKIDDERNIQITFENQAKLIIKAVVEFVDWTWQIDQEDGKNIIFCDSGTLTSGVI